MEKFAIGDLVWGKVRGHPWWPGVVTAVSGPKATVHFIGDDS